MTGRLSCQPPGRRVPGATYPARKRQPHRDGADRALERLFLRDLRGYRMACDLAVLDKESVHAEVVDIVRRLRALCRQGGVALEDQGLGFHRGIGLRELGNEDLEECPDRYRSSRR